MGVVNELTGDAAASYLSVWMATAIPGHHGLDARRLSRDALAAMRDRRALHRLRLGRATRRALPAAQGRTPAPVVRSRRREPRPARAARRRLLAEPSLTEAA